MRPLTRPHVLPAVRPDLGWLFDRRPSLGYTVLTRALRRDAAQPSRLTRV